MREINYDEVISPPKLRITIGGNKYEVEQPSLQQIIDYEQKVKDLVELVGKVKSSTEAGEIWINIIRSVFTSIPEEELRKKSMPMIRMIAKDCSICINESAYADAPVNDGQEEGKKKAE